MKTGNSLITCPKCGHVFNVDDALSHRLEEELKVRLDKEKGIFTRNFEAKQREFHEKEIKFEQQKAEQDLILQKKLEEEKTRLSVTLSARLKEENRKELVGLREEIDKRKKENQAFKDKEMELKERLEKEKTILTRQFEEKQIALREKEKKIEKQKAEQEVLLQKRLEEEKNRLSVTLAAKVKEENCKELESLRGEIQERKKENQALKDKEIELEKLKRRFDEREKDLELAFQKKLNQQTEEMADKISKRESEKVGLVLAEKDKRLEDLKKQIKEMERKAEQGSIQLQGEVLEKAMEEILMDLFNTDEIKEVPKGKKGADVIQHVKDSSSNLCGKIMYECKRTKNFQNVWIEKLRKDQLREKADIAVLVSDNLPFEDNVSMGMIEGIWICNYQSFPGLALALREGLVRIHQALESQQNRGDKMNRLYDYLTSHGFRLQIGAIIEGFLNLKGSIQKERVAMEKLWAQREKQIEGILLNTSNFFGAVKGIAGSDILDVPLLELSGIEEQA
jgi:hypothetical protein